MAGRKKKRSKIKKLFYIISALILLVLIYGIAVEPYLIDTEEETVTVRNLPESWEGEEIAVVGDFQTGMWANNTAAARRVIDKIVDRKPKAVLLLGDFIYKPKDDLNENLKTVADYLKPLTKTDIPVYAVLGNHDYGMEKLKADPNEEAARKLTGMLEGLGIEVLKNESVQLATEENPFYLVGMGAKFPNNANPEKAFATVEEQAPRMVLMHHPDTIEKIPNNAFSFAVAGHTHGGQIQIPLTPDWTWLTYTPRDLVHAAGWITGHGFDDKKLYVNKGIGFSYFPVRINCAPELTIFTLQSDESTA
ncbi:metallophosphoesterase [Virgibacillus kekensis]|uniref:Metallophosphoesterase n=1 Tax=Virgibacillus kekensis TaxID=202261 RepID=A0ABV9DFX2_9BACI